MLTVMADDDGAFTVRCHVREDDGELIDASRISAIAWTLTNNAGSVINGRQDVAATVANPLDISLVAADLDYSNGQERLISVEVTYDGGTLTGEAVFEIESPPPYIPTFKDTLGDDLSTFFNLDEFADEVVYTPLDDDAVVIGAIIDKDDPLLEPYVRGPKTAHCSITVKKSEVSAPQHGDTFTFKNETWEFDPSRGVFYEDDEVLEIGLERQLS